MAFSDIVSAMETVSYPLDVLYDLICEFHEDYVSNPQNMAWDAQHRPHVIGAKFSAILEFAVKAKQEVDVYVTPESDLLKALFVNTAQKMKQIEELRG